MHSEWLEVDERRLDAVEAHPCGGAARRGGRDDQRAQPGDSRGGRDSRPYRGETRLFIRPGYRFRVVDAAGDQLPPARIDPADAGLRAGTALRAMMAAYRHAVAQRYRFFSYGDAMLVERERGA
jgi:S-adenosylmethionine:tRNA ribosyltransferase-isomerase